MDVIGFTDEELSELNTSDTTAKHGVSTHGNYKSPSRTAVISSSTVQHSKQTSIRTSGQRKERTSCPAAKHATPIGLIHGASLSRSVENSSSEMKQGKGPSSNSDLPDEQPCADDVLGNALPGNDSGAASSPLLEDDNPFKADIPSVVEDSSMTEASEPSNDLVQRERQLPDQSSGVQLTKLEQLQIAQAKLEHENKQKQKELKQTITEKFTKTSEQARLLQTLQDQVACLEREMSCDISILRDRIDDSNRKYFEARQRHERAEQEYVASKLDLFNCEQLKEGLEEHLFTIIQLNETKKSEKLQELHDKLDKLSFK